MKNLRSIGSAAAALLLAACGGGGDGDQNPAVQYSRLVVFGDSLSDVGSYATPGIVAMGGGKYNRQRPGRDDLGRAARGADEGRRAVRRADRTAGERAARRARRADRQRGRLLRLRAGRRARHQPDRHRQRGDDPGRSVRLPGPAHGAGGHPDAEPPRGGRRQLCRHRTRLGAGRRQRPVREPGDDSEHRRPDPCDHRGRHRDGHRGRRTGRLHPVHGPCQGRDARGRGEPGPISARRRSRSCSIRRRKGSSSR